MTHKERRAKVYHADLWGLRDDKYAWLQGHNWKVTEWQEIRPVSEFYLFVPRDEAALDLYQKFIKVTDIFPVNSVGIVTSRDHFVFDFDREALKRRIRIFIDPSFTDQQIREAFKLQDSQAWNLSDARQAVRNDEHWEAKIVRCLYRLFDVRWLFYHPAMIERGREEVMRHMLAEENLALVSMRQVSLDQPYTHVLVTNMIVDNRTFVSAKGITLVFPLYLLPGQRGLLSTGEIAQRQPNLAPKLVDNLTKAYAQELQPEDLFCYVYAVLYAPSYREKYAEFLRLDFPRIPFTSDPELFKKMAELGKRLVNLHLLRSPELDSPIARFQGEGDGKVETGKKGLRYDAERERVYINQSQYFEGVPSEVWEYQIGGYQVCHKWLKDRKDRTLTLDDIRTYCYITTALSKTIEIQTEIDQLYSTAEETLGV